MRFLIAPDSFKDSMSAPVAARAIANGIQDAMPDAVCDIVPMADGGDGTGAALRHSLITEEIPLTVRGPLGDVADAPLLLLQDSRALLVESALACGIMLIPQEERNVEHSSTYGVGQMILKALEAPDAELLLTLGGSGTNDGGLGMLLALGARF